MSSVRHYVKAAEHATTVSLDQKLLIPPNDEIDKVGAEVQADCICIAYLCVPVYVIEVGGASSTPA